ncbi:asparaginase domain-containing protein [Sulfuriroseicoccus oceanibius]|uniref:Asparaginase n=1 Tax=Sulfuriroseicoccus oceanibius TaxID=2707525 RepID=A0A6B3L186_9BACT|nr:asparaginase domain-containing protein [Sulfuriroseicoccus oceanibius]QQL46058.1 asparaginase [Sulfuriroseicoccus oceanibius]
MIHEPIQIITTGGTIDKIYFDAKSTYQVGCPNIKRVLEELPVTVDYQITPLLQKDSLEITDADRQVLADTIKATPGQRIIVTHGTDTMVESAMALADIQDKTIVFTGALEPAMFKTSDAIFNIGCAIAAVQALPAGIYITMNGRIFPYDNVVKDVENSRFVPRSELS